ncbi:MAG: S9 family peptidase [Acidobacteriota bacterium]
MARPDDRPTVQFPVAKREPHHELRHGETVVDHYHWLRDKESPATQAYLEAENAYTSAMTTKLQPFADALYDEMLGRIKQTDLSVPQKRGAWYYYSRTTEGLQYATYCRKPAGADGLLDEDATEQRLLDVNDLAKDKQFMSLGAFELSDDGRHLAFSTDDTGYRQYRLYVKNLDDNSIGPAVAECVTSVVWAGDGRTLFYTVEDAVTKRSDRLFRVALGGTPEEVFHEPDALYRVGVGKTRDRQYLVLGIYSTDTWEQRLLPAVTPDAAWRTLVPREKGHKYDVEHRDGVLYIRTNKDAKNYRVVTATVADPAPSAWKEWIAHDSDASLKALDLFKQHAVVTLKHEGLYRLRIFDFAAKSWHEITFPDAVYTAVPAENPEYDTVLFRFSYQSLITPSSVYDYDMKTHARTMLKQQEVLGGYDPTQYDSERLWAVANDGSRVPISIVYRRGFQRDGTAPLLLYAYGSYGFGMSASFLSTRLSLLDRGFAFAIAHIRGGDELGERWHEDGMLMNKRNSFTDFIECAEFLIAERWTASDRLAIQGGSAGGLLMGAVLNFRPELFKAAHAAVPFVDVMNTMWDESLPLTVGEYLEWGDPREIQAYVYMKSYAPYENIKPMDYPALLVTTSLNDSQVMYWEPAKWVAKLRLLKTDDNPLLFKINMSAGHGGSSGRYDRLREIAFEYAWLISQLGVGP